RNSRAMRLTIRSRFSTSFPTLDIVAIAVFFSSLVVSRWPRTLGTRSKLGTRSPHCALLDPLLIQLALKDALHEDAGRMHQVGIELAGFDEVFYLGNRHLGRGRHHGVEVARRLAVNEIARLVALPRLNKGKIRLQRVFHQIKPAIELAGLFVFGHYSTHTRRCEKCWDAGASRADAFRESALGN